MLGGISAGQIQTTDRLVARAGSLQPHDSLLVLCRKILKKENWKSETLKLANSINGTDT